MGALGVTGVHAGGPSRQGFSVWQYLINIGAPAAANGASAVWRALHHPAACRVNGTGEMWPMERASSDAEANSYSCKL